MLRVLNCEGVCYPFCAFRTVSRTATPTSRSLALAQPGHISRQGPVTQKGAFLVDVSGSGFLGFIIGHSNLSTAVSGYSLRMSESRS